MMIAEATVDPRLDLVLERIVPVPRARVWAAWTEPRLLMKWFCPRPWMTTECDIDLRPGGIFRTVMQGPDGERADNLGSWLHVDAPARLIWTSTVGPGFRPAPPQPAQPTGFHFTVILTFSEVEAGTRYHAHVMHASESDRQMHAEMGFDAGWNAALDQLIETMSAAT